MRETISTPVVLKQTHDDNVNIFELVMERVHAGAPVLAQAATAAGPQESFLQNVLPRLLGMGWETTAHAGVSISKGSRRTSL